MALNPSPDQTWHLSIDGTAWPNPGKIGLGIVLRAPDGSVEQRSVQLHEAGCNNEAELRALYHGLETAKAAGALMVSVCSDSDFVVRHSRGEMKTRTVHLQSLVDQVRQLMASFASVELRWIPRHRNSLADELARKALGLAVTPAKPPGRSRKK